MVRDVIFVHGWGFSSSLWNGVIGQLDGIRPHTVDLGFCAPPKNAENLPAEAVLIGHSLGVMWLLRHLPDNPAGFISINGFDCFYKYMDQTLLKAMQLRLKRNPLALMQTFWTRCGYDADTKADSVLDAERLANGLDWLMQWNMEEVKHSLSCPVLALASSQDRIISHTATNAIWDKYDLRWRATDKHILPFSDTAWCAQQIKEFCLDLG